MTNLLTIARLEFTSAARLKWIRLMTAAFATLGVAAAYSSGAADDISGPDGFARTTVALVPVALILIPLAALVLGVSCQCAEHGGEPFLFAQPVSRTTVLVGRWLGELATLSGAVTLGFGGVGVFIATSSGVAGVWPFAFFVATSLALGAIFLSIAAAIAAATEKRVTALGIATFAWFFFVLLYDGVALSLAGWLTGSFGGRVLFASVFGNPADVIRIVMLQTGGTSNVLGAAGEAWTRFLGGNVRATLNAASAVGVWIIAPLIVAVTSLRARDL